MPWSVPLATGDPSPVWPLDLAQRDYVPNFGAGRAKGRRQHAGQDLPAARGTLVFAPEAGQVARVYQHWTGPPTYPRTSALLIQGTSGLVYLLGEVEPGSWKVKVGDMVPKGQAIARIGALGMLHFETYRPGTTLTRPWRAGAPPPSNLLDPTEYVLRMAGAAPVTPWPTQPWPAPAPAPMPPMAPSVPEIPKSPQPRGGPEFEISGGAGAGLGVLVVALALASSGEGFNF